MTTLRLYFVNIFTAALLAAGLLVLLAGVAAAQSLPSIDDASGQVPPGYYLVAENNLLKLYLNPDETQFAVVDRRNGKVWLTNPPGAEESIASALWQTHARSQIFFSFTDERRRQIRESDPLTESAVVTYEPIENGVRVVYHMQTRGFVITTDYILGPDYLEVRVPDDGIEETGEFILVYLEVVPFFGAATEADEGYMFFPDSSGAIAPFRERQGRYARQFEEYVYGPENYPFIEYSPMTTLNRQVPMPVFGLKHEDGAFLGVIVEGDYDAKIVAAPAGYIVDYYRTNAKFVMRREYLAPLRRDTTVQTVESQRIRTDRAIRYYLLPEDQASYTGMALRYRQHLIEEQKLRVGRVANEDGVAPMHLRIFHSVLEDRILVDHLVVMTTFEEAQEMVQELINRGVEAIDVSLVGWTRDGYAGRYPRRLPVEKAIGGEEGLREFAQWARSRGIRVYLEDNYIDAYSQNGGFSRRGDVVRDPSRLPIRNEWSPGFRRDRYLLSPLVALENFARRDIPRVAELGVSGLDFERFGWTLISDRNANYRAERRDVAEAWTEIVKLSRDYMGGAVVQGGNMYLVPHVDKVMRAPMTQTTHLFASRSVPFYQIAIRSVVPYYGWPGNLRSEPGHDLLREIEYGSLPIFELTKESSSELKDAVRYNILFSSEFDVWVDAVMEEYELRSRKMGYLQNLAIIDHDELAEDVFQTVYEDGTRIITNYGLTDYRDGDLVVASLDYVHIPGGNNE